MKRRKIQKALAAVMVLVAVLSFGACRLVPDASSDAAVSVVLKPSVPAQTDGAVPTDAAEPTASPTESEAPAATEETEAPAQLPPVPTYQNPLTGTLVDVDPSGLRPIAVVVDNSTAARAHQTGLERADILYETLTAPGITRFLAVYSDYRTVPEICNVRAGKVHDVKLASQYNAVLICHGGHADDNADYDFVTAMKRIYGSEYAYINTQKEPAWSAQNGETLGTLKCYTDGYRSDLKYDTVVSPAAIEFTAAQKKYSDFSAAGYSVSGEVKRAYDIASGLPAGETATGVTVKFTAAGAFSPLEKTVSFKYSAADGKYLRFEDSAPHVDASSGRQLAFDNVLVLRADVRYIAGDSEIDPLTTSVAVYGSGTGYYLSGGRYVSIVWVNTAEEGLTLYSPGGEIALAAGNTYIGYVDRTNDGAVTLTM